MSFRKTFEREMLTTTLLTTLLKLFCELLIDAEVILKSVIVPHGKRSRSAQGMNTSISQNRLTILVISL